MDPTLNAEQYGAHALIPRTAAFMMIAKNYDRIAQLPPGSRVIDIGCGTGEVTWLLSYFSNLKL